MHVGHVPLPEEQDKIEFSDPFLDANRCSLVDHSL